MATDQEILALAAKHRRQATIPLDKWLRNVRDHRDYPWRQTAWGKALLALEQLPPVAPPVTPPASDAYLSVVRNLLVWASVSDDAVQQSCRLGPKWRNLVTADKAYPVTDQQIAAMRAAGQGVFAWGDCHTTFPNEIRAFARQRGLDGWYGEGESPQAFDAATRNDFDPDLKGVGVIVNLSALLPEQLFRVGRGEVLVTAELYRNVQPNMQPDWRNANKGIGGNCVAVYESSSEGAVYTPISKYIADGLFNKATDSVYCEGMRAEDWQALLP